MNRLLWWLSTPLRKIDNLLLGDPMRPHQDLLDRGARGELTTAEVDKIGAWLLESPNPDELSLFEEMEMVLLALHKRRTLTSADPLWGRIDALADRLRA